MLKKEKITQKCRRKTEKGQWKGHHRVPQDTQVPKGSHDYVLRFPNAEHQKKMFDVGSKLKWSLVLILDYIVPQDFVSSLMSSP